MGNMIVTGAVALGAKVIEKHFTLARADGGVDSTFSLEPDELKQLCNSTKTRKNIENTDLYKKVLGVVDFEKSEEEGGRALRPSIYVSRPIKAGESFSLENLRTVRPSNGLPPKNMDKVLGRKAAHDISFGVPLTWDKVV